MKVEKLSRRREGALQNIGSRDPRRGPGRRPERTTARESTAIRASGWANILDERPSFPSLAKSLGAKIGLLTAAFDDRIQGLVSVCGFDPLRLDTPDKGTEGIKHYSHLHGLMPRLGFFLGHEDRVPFDFDEVLASIAPKPVLLVAPTLDRYARIADVRREVAESRKVYQLMGDEEALQFETPLDINRFSGSLQEHTFDWIAKVRSAK